MNIAIVDDERAVSEQLTSFLERYGKEQGLLFQITAYEDGIDLLDKYVPKYDIIFLDIEMPHSNGMKVAQRLRKIDRSVCLVFVTNLAKYAVAGYAVAATDYIVKPLAYDSFQFHFRRILESASHVEKASIGIVTDKSVVRLQVADILYLEVVNHFVVYHTVEGNYKTWCSLKEAEKPLEKYHFARCNNCYLVNLQHVRSIDSDLCTVGTEQLRISRSRKKAFVEAALSLI